MSKKQQKQQATNKGQDQFTRSLRDEIKAAQEALKALRVREKEERAKRSAERDAKPGGRATRVVKWFMKEFALSEPETMTNLYDVIKTKYPEAVSLIESELDAKRKEKKAKAAKKAEVEEAAE